MLQRLSTTEQFCSMSCLVATIWCYHTEAVTAGELAQDCTVGCVNVMCLSHTVVTGKPTPSAVQRHAPFPSGSLAIS